MERGLCFFFAPKITTFGIPWTIFFEATETASQNVFYRSNISNSDKKEGNRQCQKSSA